MKKNIKTICFDDDLMLEAYRFEGIVKSFPNHFHDYYVIGFVESGTRQLFCGNAQYIIKPGDVLLFNPNDSHSCMQNDSGTFSYGAVNISLETMAELTGKITGSSSLPVFSRRVLPDSELIAELRPLHRLIMSGAENSQKNADIKEEMLKSFVSALIEGYSVSDKETSYNYLNETARACDFMEQHFSEHISLEQLCGYCNLSKSTLLRAFTKIKGVTPYRYLQSVRINKAKAMLENGMNPTETAICTGFSDQSHFTNSFNMYIGLSPAAYGRIYKDRSGENKNDE